MQPVTFGIYTNLICAGNLEGHVVFLDSWYATLSLFYIRHPYNNELNKAVQQSNYIKVYTLKHVAGVTYK